MVCVFYFFFLLVFFFILVCGVIVCFRNRERKKVCSWKGGEDLGEDEQGKTMIIIYCIKKLLAILKSKGILRQTGCSIGRWISVRVRQAWSRYQIAGQAGLEWNHFSQRREEGGGRRKGGREGGREVWEPVISMITLSIIKCDWHRHWISLFMQIV